MDAPATAELGAPAAQSASQRTYRVALPAAVQDPQDLLLLCCRDGDAVMTNGALLKELSPQVLREAVELAQRSDRDKGLPEVPVLDDAADDWLQLLRLAQAGPAGAAEQQASIALDQAKRVMQLLHKYNIASLWPAYAQLLARTLPVGPASSRSGTEATLELLAMSRRWDLKQVEQVITHALKQRLDAVSSLSLGALSVVDDLQRWLSQQCGPTAGQLLDDNNNRNNSNNSDDGSSSNSDGGQLTLQPPKSQLHAVSEADELASLLLSLTLPVLCASVQAQIRASAQASAQEQEAGRFRAKLLWNVPECCPSCYKVLSSVWAKEQHMKDTGHRYPA